MPRQNRIDPWGDLHAATERGMFTGNRGCLLDDSGTLKRHHNGSLWIICLTEFRGWSHPLDQPRTWTPLFFLDDAVALAAGHRPCGLCRRDAYLSYQAGVTEASESDTPVLAGELNRRLAAERLQRGRGLDRGGDRILWSAELDDLPDGTVVVDPESREPVLLAGGGLYVFGFGGWSPFRPAASALAGQVEVLTPPTSVAAMGHGYEPVLHLSAT